LSIDATPTPPTYLRAGIGGRAGGAATTTNETVVEFNISVSGVTDPGLARAVGAQMGDAAADALARRGVIVAARTGGG
jgi:hypothetical protein